MQWWQTGVIYQVYPRSFQDTNGDGVGDLKGVTARLPYLVELGIDAIWLSPVFPSPMADFGYDISDYTGIDPLFGTMADFDALVARAHELGLRLIVDFVPNHTSVQHPWFVESRTSRDGAKRDWYIWRDPAAGGGPPNNWLSEFGGPAWAFDEASGQYYYHAFLASQPDLNWCNPQVREAMHDVMRFAAYYGEGLVGAHLPFNFSLIEAPWRADVIGSLIDRYENSLPQGAWPNWVLGNHDRPRLASRVGAEQARMAATLLLTLRGTPTLYYGDEIGMTQLSIPPAQVRDPWERNIPGQGRDGCRTPMQWDASTRAGFSTGEPWLLLAADSAIANVRSARADPFSLLNLYRRLLALRRAHPAPASGSYRLHAQSANVLAFERVLDGEQILVALNFGGEVENTIMIPASWRGILLQSSRSNRAGEAVYGSFALHPYEAVIILPDIRSSSGLNATGAAVFRPFSP